MFLQNNFVDVLAGIAAALVVLAWLSSRRQSILHVRSPPGATWLVGGLKAQSPAQ